MLKLWTKALAFVAILGLVGTIQAAKPAAGDKEGLRGKITAVDTTKKTITVTSGGKKDPQTLEVNVDGATITLDGKDATLDDLSKAVATGIGARFAGATKDNLKATSVTARTMGAGGGKKKGGDAPAPTPAPAK